MALSCLSCAVGRSQRAQLHSCRLLLCEALPLRLEILGQLGRAAQQLLAAQRVVLRALAQELIARAARKASNAYNLCHLTHHGAYAL
eukprot:6211085-Pleurochrysis_carterae.AAC.1